MKRILYVLSILVLAFMLVACSADNKPADKPASQGTDAPKTEQPAVVLRLAHNQTSLDNPYQVGLDKFAEELKKVSGGAMTAEVFPGTLGTNESELAMKLTTDSVDVVVTSPAFMSSTGVKEFDILSLLYLFDSFENWEAKIDGEFGTKMAELITEKTNNEFKVIGYYSSGVRNFYGKKPIVEPQDAKGLNIRTQSSIVQQEFWKQCGANPINVGWQELYQALNTGTADAAENDYTNMSLKEHHKTPNGKYTSLTNHDFTTRLLLVNGNKFNKYTEEQQKWILEAAKLSVDAERKSTYEMLEVSKKKILDDGGEINEVNLPAFKEIAIKIQDDFAKQNNVQDLLDLIRK